MGEVLKKIGGVGWFSKILRNFQGGSWQMLMSTYKVGGWGEKRPKTWLRNTWMVHYGIKCWLQLLFWSELWSHSLRIRCSSAFPTEIVNNYKQRPLYFRISVRKADDEQIIFQWNRSRKKLNRIQAKHY